MSCFGNKEILIKIDELPKVNGMHIKNIYLKAYDKRGVIDYTIRPQDALYYYVLEPYFYTHNSEKYPLIRTKTLPKEFAEIFDNILEYEAQYIDSEEKHKIRIKPTSIWYRTTDSGSGSFIDQSIEICGNSVFNGGKNNISFRRNSKCSFDMQPQHPIAQLMLNTLNIDVNVELMSECEYSYYPCTTLRRVDNWNYPTPVCDGWRWLCGMPYVSLDNNKSMRILNENIKAHIFVLKVEPQDVCVGMEYIRIEFSNGYEKEPEKYCNIKSWGSNHIEDPNGMIHYRVDNIKMDNVYNEMVAECIVMGQKMEKYSKKTYSLNSFYQIVRIINTNDLNN